MSEHKCHATACNTPVPPRMLMCAAHWSMVPKDLQNSVLANYRHGQCDDKRPSREWSRAAFAAICAVADREGRVKRV